MQQTLAIIKPDAVRKNIIGKITNIIESNELAVKYMCMRRLTKENAEKFYAVHKGKPFFPPLVEFMTSGPCVVMVLEGENVISRWRALMGATNPEEALPGTIRSQFAASIRENCVHGSDSPENALYEINCLVKGQ